MSLCQSTEVGMEGDTHNEGKSDHNEEESALLWGEPACSEGALAHNEGGSAETEGESAHNEGGSALLGDDAPGHPLTKSCEGGLSLLGVEATVNPRGTQLASFLQVDISGEQELV